MNSAKATFGNIDIYLFDQILRGRFDQRRRILDAGCGNGRNLTYLLQQGYEVHGIDRKAEAIDTVIAHAAQIAPQIPATHFQVASLEALPYPDQHFDAVICSAVLHFADNHQHFLKMVHELWRVLETGGLLFARLASSIAIDQEWLIERGNGRYLLPDGSERYLTDLPSLLRLTKQLDGVLTDPVKTTNVQNLRCMTTWCVEKQ